ncbi:MAG: hypothetical protein JNJ50_29005 [Acidobacteria bacterium]|nr:hypothetical protein [Acidobacteriota bacterium]
MKRFSLLLVLTIAFSLLSAQWTNNSQAARSASPMTADLKEGKLELKSVGPLAFGPEGVLFIADPKAASIVAVATGDIKAGTSGKLLKVEAINQKIAALLGTSADQILIEDLAINPISHNAYLSVSRGRGPEAVPVLVRVKTDGNLELVSLEKVKFSRADLPDAPADKLVGQGNRQSNPRQESITDLAFLDGRVFIAGLANEEFASTLRAVPYPFKTVSGATSVEIYHGAHGRFETRAPVRTFAPFKIGKEDHLLAAYTCTPLVQFPISDLKPGAQIKGKTIAELGNRNRPLDMIVYQAEGKTYLLMANSSRGVMKITTDNIASAEGITAPVPDKKGLTYQTVENWTGVDQLDRFDGKHATVVRRTEGGALNLETLPLP